MNTQRKQYINRRQKMETNTYEVTESKTYLVSIRAENETVAEDFIFNNLQGITNNEHYFPKIDDEVKVEQVSSTTFKNKIIDVEEFEKWKDKKDLYIAVDY